MAENWEIKQKLGSGAFSVVKMCQHKKTGEKAAVKILKREDVVQDKFQMEVDILTKVKHPNVIQLKELFEDENHVYLVMELVVGGELFERIVEKGSYSESDAAQLVKQILSAVDYLHERGIVHRDLKPENLLLRKKSDDLDVAIADFGLSKFFDEQLVMQTACGSPSYVAPEVLRAEGYGKSVDIWSVGVITYILLCGFPPFYGEDMRELFDEILSASFDFPEEYWDEVSPEAKDFINRILIIDSEKRPTAKECLEHPWIKGKAKDTIIKQDKMKNFVYERQQTRSKMLAEYED